MRNTGRVIVVSLGVVGALAVAYVALRSRPIDTDRHDSPALAEARIEEPATAPPSPSADAPVQAAATATANAPSRDALRELQRCVFAFRDLRSAQALADCSAYEGKPQYAESYAQCMNGWMNATERIAAAQADTLGCQDTADIERRYFEATKEVAKRGDIDAQLCYLQGEFGQITTADFAEYQQVARGYVDAAFKRGDWRVVVVLNRRHFHPTITLVRLLEEVGEPETQYRMTRLLRLGASGSYGSFLESRLDGMKHAPLNPELALPRDIVTNGDAWAQQTYTDYFSSTPALTREPVVCVPPPKWLPDP